MNAEPRAAGIPNGQARRIGRADGGQAGRWRTGLRRLARNRFAFSALIVLVVLIGLGIFAPWVVPHDPLKISARGHFAGVSTAHWMGADNLGRDLFSRVLYGIRMSALVAGGSIGAAAAIGVTLGLIAGYATNWVDQVIMRVMDILYAFPPLLLALAMIATFGTGLDAIIIAVAVGRIPGFARVTRAAVLSLKEREFVEAANALGASNARIMLRHILPNCVAPIIVMLTLSIAVAILTEASLSFLGLGIQPPTPSLGGLLKDALPYMHQAPWMAIFPGLTIAIIVFSLNLLGDGLRDVLDPRSK